MFCIHLLRHFRLFGAGGSWCILVIFLQGVKKFPMFWCIVLSDASGISIFKLEWWSDMILNLTINGVGLMISLASCLCFWLDLILVCCWLTEGKHFMWFAVTDWELMKSQLLYIGCSCCCCFLEFPLFPTISSLCCPSLSFSVFQVFLSCLFVMDCVIPIRLGAARAVGSVAFVKDWRAFKRKKKRSG